VAVAADTSVKARAAILAGTAISKWQAFGLRLAAVV
jgi:hypothetical protein